MNSKCRGLYPTHAWHVFGLYSVALMSRDTVMSAPQGKGPDHSIRPVRSEAHISDNGGARRNAVAKRWHLATPRCGRVRSKTKRGGVISRFHCPKFKNRSKCEWPHAGRRKAPESFARGR